VTQKHKSKGEFPMIVMSASALKLPVRYT